MFRKHCLLYARENTSKRRKLTSKMSQEKKSQTANMQKNEYRLEREEILLKENKDGIFYLNYS